ncbi:hypothetical protein [Massilia glaciei]|nr:hypothetical protein [Massilia glaciei]
MQTTFKRGLLAMAAAALAACGGGNGFDGDDKNPFNGKEVTIRGTVASSYPATAPAPLGTSNAIAKAAIIANCRSGYGVTDTAADGSYTVKITSPASGPCVVTATTFQGTALGVPTTILRSVALGDGSVANITPLTELLYVYMATQVTTTALPVLTTTSTAGSVLAINEAFNKIMTTPALFNASVASVATVVRTAGGTVNPLTVPADYLTGAIIARSTVTNAAGNEQSMVLDQLRTRNLINANGYPQTATLLTPTITHATANKVAP